MTSNFGRALTMVVAALAVSLLAMVGPLASPGNTQQADPPPPTLTGETLLATTHTGVYGPDEGPGEVVDLTVTCSDSERRISYTARGPAAGPYQGTYEETGTFKLGDPTVFGPRVVESFEARFEIDAVINGAPFTVIGTKKAPVASLEEAYGDCYTTEDVLVEGDTEETFAAVAGVTTTRYEATIETPSGQRFRDSGNAEAGLTSQRHFSSSGALDGEYASFGESFSSERSAPEPLLPTAVDQCKDGGFAAFQVFRNQGDCVSFVETEGKNEPGQNQI